MKKTLKLESLDALPPALRSRLEPHRALFRRYEYLDDVLGSAGVRSVAEDLDAFLRSQCIHAYHCTKEPTDGHFAARGLRLTDVQAHQAEFLRAFGSHFTAEEVAAMEAAWRRHFVEGGQLSSRNGRIWACLSRPLVKSPGTEVFFKYLGGEAIFMPLKRHPTIEPKLAKLGRPVVVEFGLAGAEAWFPLGMAKYVLSRHHQSTRPGAHLYEVETSSRTAVHPGDILAVTPLEEFLP